MFTTRWQICRLAGIPIYIDASWLIVLALMTLSLANNFPILLHEVYPDAADLDPSAYWIMAFVGALGFFTCLLLHELGHALVARARGMSIRGITLFLFGGVAELGEEPPSAGTEFLMAIGGPVVSVILAALCAVLGMVGFQADWHPAVVLVLQYLAAINGMVLLFNMIPAFPLDGGRVLRSFLWAATGSLRRATLWASLAGRAFAWFLIAMGLVQFFGQNWLGGIWLGLMGMFLNNAALSGYQQVVIRQALEREPILRVMNTDPITVPADLDLYHWVEDYVYRFHRKTFPVVSTEGKLEGCINTRVLADIPRVSWGEYRVGDVMDNDPARYSISPRGSALEAMEKMQRTGLSRLLVVNEQGSLVGIVSLKDLVRFLSLKMELEGAENDSDVPGSRLPLTKRERRDVSST